jgi:hypothetical protein
MEDVQACDNDGVYTVNDQVIDLDFADDIHAVNDTLKS